jgi:hypothetical protein
VPPATVNARVYGLFVIPRGTGEGTVITGLTVITMENVFFAVWTGGPASVTVTTTLLLVPADVGVPLITPVVAFMVSPFGSPVADQLYGVVPPLALTVAEYAPFTPPLGSGDGVVICNCAATGIENVFGAVNAGDDESLTVITTLVLAPAAVGVPLMRPVEELMVSPFGRPVADQEYGDCPPLAVTVALYGVPAAAAGNEGVVI